MFEIVTEFLEQFFEILPILTVFCIVLGLLGNMTFRR